MNQKDPERESGQAESESKSGQAKSERKSSQAETGQGSARTESGPGSARSGPESAESQREFESRLDAYADKISRAVGDGVARLEEVFERGKRNVESDTPESGVEGLKGSPRSGIILIGIGIVWLLYIAGLFEHVIFPILLIIVGIYFVIRNR